MLNNLLPIVLSGFFALAGVLLSSFLERMRNREQRLQTVFNKKVEAYTNIVRQTHEIAIGGLFQGRNSCVIKGGMDFIGEFGNYTVFASPEVLELAVDFGTTAANNEMEATKKLDKLAALHNKIYRRCQKELGVTDLQKNLVEK